MAEWRAWHLFKECVAAPVVVHSQRENAETFYPRAGGSGEIGEQRPVPLRDSVHRDPAGHGEPPADIECVSVPVVVHLQRINSIEGPIA